MSELKMDDVYDGVIRFLTGDFPYAPECVNMCMALQGAITVRKGPNKDGRLHWFHAFTLSTLAAFAGGTFNFIWMGQPSGILSNDLFMAFSIIAFVIVNYMPMDIGFKLFKTLPFTLVITSFAQLFRSLGTIKFLTSCFNHFKGSPSAYYPIPVFGPILYGTLLGNMGPLVLKGLEAHVGNGVPWAVQNGLFVCTFYHFYVHDQEGFIGNVLRNNMPIAKLVDLDEKVFAVCFVGLFMQITGILQLPEFLGPKFTPFGSDILTPFIDPSTWTMGKYEGAYAEQQKEKAKLKQEAAAAAAPSKQDRSLPAFSPADPNQETTQGAKKKKKKKKKSGANKEKTN